MKFITLCDPNISRIPINNSRVVRNDFTGTCNVMFIGRPINDIRRNADDLIDSHVHFHAKVPGAALLS